MKSFLLLGLLLLNFSSSASEQCNAAVLKSVLFEVRLDEMNNEWSSCQRVSTSLNCQTIKNNLSRFTKDTQRVHLESKKRCSNPAS